MDRHGGIRRRAGFVADARGAMLTLKASPPPAAMTGHQVNYWLAMVRATGVADGRADDFALDVHEPSRERMREWLAANRKRPAVRSLRSRPPPRSDRPRNGRRELGALIDLLARRRRCRGRAWLPRRRSASSAKKLQRRAKRAR